MNEREVFLEELERERLLRLRAELELAEVLLRQAEARRDAAARGFEEVLGTACQARGLAGQVQLDLERGVLRTAEGS